MYWSGTVDAYVQEVKTFQQAAKRPGTGTNGGGDERDASRSAQVGGGSSPADAQRQCVIASSPAAKRPAVKIEPTTETATIAGRQATKIMVYADGKPYQEVWLAKDLTLKADLDLSV